MVVEGRRGAREGRSESATIRLAKGRGAHSRTEPRKKDVQIGRHILILDVVNHEELEVDARDVVEPSVVDDFLSLVVSEVESGHL